MKVDNLLDGMDENNISSVLFKWKEINTIKKEIAQIEDMLKAKFKNYLKEREWDRYLDSNTKISISMSIVKRETIDKAKVKEILSPGQFAEVIKISTSEQLRVTTPEQREILKKVVR